MSFEEVVEVFELLVLLGSQVLELIFVLFRDLVGIDTSLIEGQHFFFLSLYSSA